MKLLPQKTAVEQLRAEKHALIAEIAQTEEEVEDAYRESIRENPEVRPAGDMSGPVAPLLRRLEKLQKRLVGLEREIPLRDLEAHREAEEVAIKTVTDNIRELRMFDTAERAGYKALGQWIAEGLSLWLDEVVAAVEARDAKAAEVIASGILGSVSDDLRAQFDGALQPVVKPLPQDFLSMVSKLIDATSDPHGRGFRTDSGERVDYDSQLRKLTPDLRGRNRNIRVSGRVEVTTTHRTPHSQATPSGSWGGGAWASNEGLSGLSHGQD